MRRAFALLGTVKQRNVETRLASLLVAASYVAFAIVALDIFGAAQLFSFTALAMVCVWAPDIAWRIPATMMEEPGRGEAPEVLIKVLGWLVLLIPAAIGVATWIGVSS